MLPSLPPSLRTLPSGAAGTEIIQQLRNSGNPTMAALAEVIERHENRLNGSDSSIGNLISYLQNASRSTGAVVSSPWGTYVPTVAGSPTFTLNTVNAAYVQVDRAVTVRIVINVTVTAPGSPITCTLPIPAIGTAGFDQALTAWSGDSGDACGAIIQAGSPTLVSLYAPGTSGGGVFNAGSYALWAQGTYEAA